jgi:hypothetical protein
MLFQLESGGLLEAQDVLYVLELKKKLLSNSALDDRVMQSCSRKGLCSLVQERASTRRELALTQQ